MNLAEDDRVPTTMDNLAPLKSMNRWIVWKYLPNGDKVPINVHSVPIPYKASDRNDPAIHMSYDQAVRLMEEHRAVDGIGFVPQKGDGITFLDFDAVVGVVNGGATKILKPWVIELVEELDSYAEITPSGTGLRVPVMGSLPFKGGHVTLEGNVLEAYDDDQFLTITERVFIDAPIIEAQDLLDRLVPYKRSTDKKARVVSEVELPEDLSETQKKVKRVFMKNDLSPAFIPYGVRYNTILTDCGKIWKTGDYTPKEFWVFLNEVNDTMCLNKDGAVEGISLEELHKVYEAITKMTLKVSGPEVLSSIGTVEEFLISIKTRVRRPHTTDWDVLWGLCKHGKKYGVMQDGLLRVDVSYGTLKKLSRKSTNKTISNSLKRLAGMGISSGKDQGDGSNHYLIDLEKITDPSSWERAKVNQGNKGGIEGDKASIPPQYYSGSLKHVLENRDLIDSIAHTSWYRGMGPTKLSYVLALVSLGGEASKAQIAEVTDRKSDSITRPLKELDEDGIIEKVRHGVYALNLESLPEEIHRYREQNLEFNRDERMAKQVDRDRKNHRYHSQSYALKDGKDDKPRDYRHLKDLARASRLSASKEATPIGSSDE